MAFGGSTRTKRALASGAAVLAIIIVDHWLDAGERSLLQTGLADECAHLLTAMLLLAAFPMALPEAFVVGALAGAVVIDLDHLPLILGSDLLTHETHRPLTHCLLSIIVVAALAGLAPASWRWLGWGLAAGFALHFWRDLATSTAGVPLLWPWQASEYITPYPLYLGSLIVCALIVSVRGVRVALTP